MLVLLLSHDVLSISEEVKILDMIETEKKLFAEIARLYGKNETSIREVMKNKEKIHASFYVAPQTARVTPIVHDKSFNEGGKSLKFLGGRYEYK
jgi:hypothetical protein